MLGGEFDQLIVFDEFEGLFEAEPNRWGQDDVFIGARGADVGELLGLEGIDDQIVVAGVKADDHPFVDFFPGSDEQASALLEVE